MGNKCVCKVDEKVAIVYEQFIRLMQECGLPKTDMDYIYCAGGPPLRKIDLRIDCSASHVRSDRGRRKHPGPVMNELLVEGDARMTLFTGSQAVAEKLTLDLCAVPAVALFIIIFLF